MLFLTGNVGLQICVVLSNVEGAKDALIEGHPYRALDMKSGGSVLGIVTDVKVLEKIRGRQCKVLDSPYMCEFYSERGHSCEDCEGYIKARKKRRGKRRTGSRNLASGGWLF